jgi:hypothetical protein
LLLAEIRYRDAHKSYLPADHRWWKRKNGKVLPGWEEGGYWQLDLHNPEFRQYVVNQCKAVNDAGVLDGLMLDWWRDDDDHLALIKAVRRAVGEKALILVNSNDRTCHRTAPYVNGLFMECYRSKKASEWHRISETLVWAEANLREPRINCLETWYQTSRQDLSRMRATTTLALTRSNGYCLFSDPNTLPTPDHLHDWYPFWDKSLGSPTEPPVAKGGGPARREFENGTAVYNPMGATPLKLTFPEDRKSVATGTVSRQHVVSPADGDIFLKVKQP